MSLALRTFSLVLATTTLAGCLGLAPGVTVPAGGRETGRAFLIGEQPEAKGYGLYSYLLFGTPPTEATRDQIQIPFAGRFGWRGAEQEVAVQTVPFCLRLFPDEKGPSGFAPSWRHRDPRCEPLAACQSHGCQDETKSSKCEAHHSPFAWPRGSVLLVMPLGFRVPLFQLLAPCFITGMRGEQLRDPPPAPPGEFFHPFPKDDCLLGVVAGLCHQEQALMVRLGLMHPAEWEDVRGLRGEPHCDQNDPAFIGTDACFLQLAFHCGEGQGPLELFVHPLCRVSGEGMDDLMR